MRSTNLPDLNAEISKTKWGDVILDTLWMDCPKCVGSPTAHWIVVPYRPEGGKLEKGQLVWTHVKGTTLSDLTLAPSYRLMTGCQLHGFVREGKWINC